MALPALPAENEDPWLTKRNAFDEAVRARLDGDLSPAQLSTTIGTQALRTATPARRRMRLPYLYDWYEAVAKLRSGTADAKVLCVGDSTTGGVGGGSASSFIQANSWPSVLTRLLDDNKVAATHGLAVPPSNSGSVTSPFDSRWTLGAGWSWRLGGTLEGFLGFGGKGAVIKASSSASGAVVFSDSRVLADRFDVYVLVTDGATGGTVSAQATGGTAVPVTTTGHANKGFIRVTVEAATASTSNTLTITRTGGTGNVWIAGIEPWASTSRALRVANAGLSGSSSASWVQYPEGSTANNWNSFAMIRAYAPDLTIIDLGINDADPANTTPTATYVDNIVALASVAAESGSVILKSSHPTTARLAKQKELRDALIARDVPFIDALSHYGDTGFVDLGWMTDTLHPNSAGYTDEAAFMLNMIPVPDAATGSAPAPPSGLPELPIAGATARWAAASLAATPGGAISILPAAIGGDTMSPSSGWGSPTLAEDTSGNRYLEFTGSEGLTASTARPQPHTVIAVACITSTPSSLGVLVGGGTASPDRGSVFVNSTGGLVANAGTSLTGSTVTLDEVFVATGVFNGTSSIVAVNDSKTTGTAGADNAAGLRIGRYGTGGSGIVGRIYDVIYYPFALTGSEIDATVAALQSAVAVGGYSR